MPPKKGKTGQGKKGKGKKGKGKKNVDIDWAVDPHFDENRAMIYIEHTDECPVFLEKAKEFEEYLCKEFPEKIFQSVLNDDGKVPAREGAFEICFAQNARTERVLVWTGIEKGPPRRDKFPASYEELLPEVERILKKLYVRISGDKRDSPEINEFNEEQNLDTQVIRDVTHSDTTT